MEARAELKYARISPMKVSIVLDLIRNKPVAEAKAILKNTPKAACEYLQKLLDSAIANGVNDPAKMMDEDRMYISECYVGAGPIIKRMRPRAQGRAFRIDKRTAHITIVVSDEN